MTLAPVSSFGSISVFFPAFNDAESISPLVRSVLEVLPTLTDDYEVLVVNDGSTDATAEVLDELARVTRQLKVIHHPTNLGYGAALRSGFGNVTKELIFYTDGDGQYDVRELTSLCRQLDPSVDVVNGFKLNRADKGHRKLLGGIYNQMTRRLFRLPIRDIDCDFRLLRRSAMQKISLEASSGAICLELVHKLALAGCVFAEVPVHHYPRPHGKSEFFKLRHVTRTAFDSAILWWTLVASGTVFSVLLAIVGESLD